MKVNDSRWHGQGTTVGCSVLVTSSLLSLLTRNSPVNSGFPSGSCGHSCRIIGLASSLGGLNESQACGGWYDSWRQCWTRVLPLKGSECVGPGALECIGARVWTLVNWQCFRAREQVRSFAFMGWFFQAGGLGATPENWPNRPMVQCKCPRMEWIKVTLGSQGFWLEIPW